MYPFQDVARVERLQQTRPIFSIPFSCFPTRRSYSTALSTSSTLGYNNVSKRSPPHVRPSHRRVDPSEDDSTKSVYLHHPHRDQSAYRCSSEGPGYRVLGKDGHFPLREGLERERGRRMVREECDRAFVGLEGVECSHWEVHL